MRTYNGEIVNKCFGCDTPFTRRSAFLRHSRVNLVDERYNPSLEHVVSGQLALIAQCKQCDHLIASAQTLKGRGKDCKCKDERLYGFSLRIVHEGRWQVVQEYANVHKNEVEEFYKSMSNTIRNGTWTHPVTQQLLKVQGECGHCVFYFDEEQALTEHVRKVHQVQFPREAQMNHQATTPIPEYLLEFEAGGTRSSSEADLSRLHPKRARRLEIEE